MALVVLAAGTDGLSRLGIAFTFIILLVALGTADVMTRDGEPPPPAQSALAPPG